MQTQSPNFAVVIPAFNEGCTIRDLVKRTLRVTPRVVVVDDGSTDGTSECLHGLPATVLRNPRNLGKGASLRAGFAHALESGCSAVVTMDGDGQHLPEDIPRLVQLHFHRPDAIVIGARLHGRDRAPRSRFLANRFADFWIGWAAGYHIVDSQSGLRLYPASVLCRLNVLRSHSSRFVLESEILIDAGRAGIGSVALPVSAIYPVDRRQSHMRPVVDIAAITRMVAWKLLSRGLFLNGLLSSLRRDNGPEHPLQSG